MITTAAFYWHISGEKKIFKTGYVLSLRFFFCFSEWFRKTGIATSFINYSLCTLSLENIVCSINPHKKNVSWFFLKFTYTHHMFLVEFFFWLIFFLFYPSIYVFLFLKYISGLAILENWKIIKFPLWNVASEKKKLFTCSRHHRFTQTNILHFFPIEWSVYIYLTRSLRSAKKNMGYFYSFQKKK